MSHLMLSVSGCRGLVGSTLTPETVVRFVSALACMLHDRRGARSADLSAIAPGPAPAVGTFGKHRPRVVVGRDGRAGGHAIAHAAIGALTASGCDVIDVGVAMTPTVGVAVDTFSADAGLVLTASHNPQEWNGLKPMLRDLKAKGPSASAPPAKSANALIEAYKKSRQSFRSWDEVGGIDSRADQAVAAHRERVIDVLDALKATKAIRKARPVVVLDSTNGSGRVATAEFLEHLGCKVVGLGQSDSGIFEHTPEPTRENLSSLGGAIKKARARVGFAQDPDADRLALIDEKGQYIGEEYTLVLAARALFSLRKPGKGATAVVNLSTSRMIEDVAAGAGVKVHRSAVGEANVVEMMRAKGSMVGGEGNGGVILPDVTFIRDSLTGMALTLALMATTGKSLSELVAEVPSYSIEKRKVEMPRREEADAAVEKIAAAFAHEKINRTDGVWVDLSSRRSWLHVRASNTEPIIRFIAEGPNPLAAKVLLDEAQRVILQGLPK